MSQYRVIIEGVRGTQEWTSTVTFGWDVFRETYWAIIEEEGQTVSWGTREATGNARFGSPALLSDTLKDYYKRKGVQGVGTITKIVRAFQQVLEYDREHNVPDGFIWEATAEEIQEHKELTA